MMVVATRDRVVDHAIVDEIRDSFLDYSMSVIVQRALPDVRDGLKPVHRRILYAMYGLGLRPDRSHKKCATVVGEVLGKYHPHGDSAVYDALVRMVQDFSLRYPLVDGQGNFGSIDGDPAAAYRYTEARLSSIALELLDDIERETVAWESNFDDRLEEPTVLPARLPGLLVNGSSGIAVGMSTNVPPHNLREVAAALRILVRKPNCSLAELMRALPGPDFPTGAFIVGTEGIRAMYETGRGRMTMRARLVTESLRGGRVRIVVTELPYAVSKLRVIHQIANLSRRGALAEIADLRDESDRDGIRLVLELKRGADLERTVALLFRRTALQSTFGSILLALDGGRQPVEFTLRDLLGRYRDHRLQVIRRRSRFKLGRAEERLHIVHGLLAALARIDEVIDEIRAAADPSGARRGLCERFGLSEPQAEAILAMRLARLTALEIEGVQAEETDLRRRIAELRELLADERKQLATMMRELDEVVKEFGDDRRTEILEAAEEGELPAMETGTADESVVITLTHQGFAKRTPIHLHRRRSASGADPAEMQRYPGDYLEEIFLARSRGWLFCFTRGGQLHLVRIESIPESSRMARGRALRTMIDGGSAGDPVIAVRAVDQPGEEKFLLFVTRQGLVKRTRLDHFSRSRPGGVIGIRLRPGDALADAAIVAGDTGILLVTRAGRSIRFREDEVPIVGTQAQGVRGIALADGDEVAGIVAAQRESTVLIVDENGHGKRILWSDLILGKRGRLGRWLLGGPGGASVVGILEAPDDAQVMLLTAGGAMTELAASSVEPGPLKAKPQPLVRLGVGDRLAAATLVHGRYLPANSTTQPDLINERDHH